MGPRGSRSMLASRKCLRKKQQDSWKLPTVVVLRLRTSCPPLQEKEKHQNQCIPPPLKDGGEGSLRSLGSHVHTKGVTNKVLLCSKGRLLNVIWQPGWGVWGRLDTCVRVAELFRCAPETVTILLISCTPI